MLPEDEQLRVTDGPERLQLARGRDPEQADAADAAECVSWAVCFCDWASNSKSRPSPHARPAGNGCQPLRTHMCPEICTSQFFSDKPVTLPDLTCTARVLRRWVYEQLFTHDAPLRPEREIVELLDAHSNLWSHTLRTYCAPRTPLGSRRAGGSTSSCFRTTRRCGRNAKSWRTGSWRWTGRRQTAASPGAAASCAAISSTWAATGALYPAGPNKDSLAPRGGAKSSSIC